MYFKNDGTRADGGNKFGGENDKFWLMLYNLVCFHETRLATPELTTQTRADLVKLLESQPNKLDYVKAQCATGYHPRTLALIEELLQQRASSSVGA